MNEVLPIPPPQSTPYVVEILTPLRDTLRRSVEILPTLDDVVEMLGKPDQQSLSIVRAATQTLTFDAMEMLQRMSEALEQFAAPGQFITEHGNASLPLHFHGTVKYLPLEEDARGSVVRTLLVDSSAETDAAFIDPRLLEGRDGLEQMIAALAAETAKLTMTDVERARRRQKELTVQTERAVARRDELLASEPWLDYKKVAHLARGALVESNGSEYASRLRRERRLLGAKVRGAYQHPAFQFGADGAVLPDMAKVLAILPKDDSGWASTFWFFQPSGVLDGRRPADVFREDPGAVIRAAEMDFVRRDDEF